MRIFFIGILLVFQVSVYAQTDFYSVQSTSKDGAIEDLTVLKSRRTILFIANDSLMVQDSFIAFVDSLQTKYPAFAFIIQPVNDSTAIIQDSSSQAKVKTSLLKQVKVQKVSKVNKKYSTDRSALVQWLMDSKKNSHFDSSFDVNWQIYLVNESGVLYAVLDSGVSNTVLQDVLLQKDFKESN